jgi:putative membrane protein
MASPRQQDRAFFAVNAAISALALALLAYLLVFRGGATQGTTSALGFLPPLNACLNGTAAALLVAGRVAIARRRPDLHRSLMVAAFVASTLFLVGYLAYHAVHADTRFGGQGALRVAYLALLTSHVLLSLPVVPLALAAFYFAWRKDFRRHTRVTRVLHPVWLYVSVTGVVVYLLLRPYYPA